MTKAIIITSVKSDTLFLDNDDSCHYFNYCDFDSPVITSKIQPSYENSSRKVERVDYLRFTIDGEKIKLAIPKNVDSTLHKVLYCVDDLHRMYKNIRRELEMLKYKYNRLLSVEATLNEVTESYKLKCNIVEKIKHASFLKRFKFLITNNIEDLL